MDIARRFEVLDNSCAGEEQAGLARAAVAFGCGKDRPRLAGLRFSCCNDLIFDGLAFPSSGHVTIVDSVAELRCRRRRGLRHAGGKAR